MAGFNAGKSEGILASIPIALLNVICTPFAVKYIDRIGRRSILLSTIPGCTLSLLALGISFYLMIYFDEATSSFTKWMALLSILAYVAFFAFGIGPAIWIITSEIFPLRLRATATSLCITTNWLSNFAVSMTFLSVMSTNVGMVLTWVVLSLFGVCFVMLVYYLVPETKGRRLEEILHLFGVNSYTAI